MPPYGLVFTIRDGQVVRWSCLSRPGIGPRSRRTDGVGDVAGERRMGPQVARTLRSFRAPSPFLDGSTRSVEVYDPRSIPDASNPYRGVDGICEVARRLRCRAGIAIALQIERIVDAGDQVVSLPFRITAVVPAAASRLKRRTPIAWTFREGKVRTHRLLQQPGHGPRSRWAVGCNRCHRRTWRSSVVVMSISARLRGLSRRDL